jgi:hypothetical protein
MKIEPKKEGFMKNKRIVIVAGSQNYVSAKELARFIKSYASEELSVPIIYARDIGMPTQQVNQLLNEVVTAEPTAVIFLSNDHHEVMGEVCLLLDGTHEYLIYYFYKDIHPSFVLNQKKSAIVPDQGSITNALAFLSYQHSFEMSELIKEKSVSD